MMFKVATGIVQWYIQYTIIGVSGHIVGKQVGMSYLTGECFIDIYKLKYNVKNSHILCVNYVDEVDIIIGGT